MILPLYDLLKASDIVKCDGVVIESWETFADGGWHLIEGEIIVIYPTNSESLYGSKHMKVDLGEGKAVVDLIDACGDPITRTYEFLLTSPITPKHMARKLIGAL